MKKILVTGVNSYIGNSFREHMKNFPEYTVDGISCRDGKWKDADFSGYDCVFHVAGIAHADSGKITPERAAEYYRVNRDLTRDVAEKAKAEGAGQFIFMSSAIVYGDSAPIGEHKIINRSTSPVPSGAYGDSKLQAENSVLPLDCDSFRVCILRPPMIYGRGSKGNYPVLAKLAGALPVFPKVDNRRSMLYIENLTEFVRLMIKNEEHGIFFPQNAEYSNTTELACMIAEAKGKHILVVPGTTPALKLLSKFTPLVDKAFGSLAYEMEMSEYRENYRLFPLSESIERTEGRI